MRANKVETATILVKNYSSKIKLPESSLQEVFDTMRSKLNIFKFSLGAIKNTLNDLFHKTFILYNTHRICIYNIPEKKRKLIKNYIFLYFRVKYM